MTPSRTVAACGFALTMLVAWPSLAADQPLPGTKILLRENAGRAKLSLSVKGVVAAPADDPTSVGASLFIYNPTSAESAVLDMPASNWTKNGSATIYKFRNTAAPNPPSPVRSAALKPTRQIKIGARALGITLDETTQGSLGAVLTIGTQRYCVLFGGATITRDEPGRFSARKASPPASCPPLEGTTTTSTLPASTTTTLIGATTTSTTVTTTSTTTTTITLADCPAAADPPLGRAIFTIGQGSPNCGDPTLYPNGPAPPFSGEVRDASNTKLADLGLGCLYTGGSFAAVLPPFSLPDGGQSVLEVATLAGTAITLTAGDGTGPENCTRGSGPGKHCLNGSAGTGGGVCSTDADCGNPPGSCEEDANCFFGPPIPVFAGAFSTCVLNAIRHDICGQADLASNTTSVSAGLAPRLYVTGDPVSPCPQCVGGTCSAGARQGLACSGGIGSKNTTIECPPRDTQYAGRLELVIPELSTGTSTMTDPDGNFCPGQLHDGAFGVVVGTPTTISETGMPLAGDPGMVFDTTLAGTFCVPASGNPIINANADLPGPAALSAKGTLSVCLLPDVCSTLCNPCSLGPLCGVVCAPCILCLP